LFLQKSSASKKPRNKARNLSLRNSTFKYFNVVNKRSDLMALFGKIFKKDEQQAEPQLEEFTELPLDLDQKQEHMKIIIEKLDDFTDTDRIIRKMRSGSIIIVNVKGIKERSMDELKHAISKFKTSVAGANGDIVGVGDEFVILTPSTARIHRGEQ
jgi:SepF-like predicted cell division protein (DUF552 family)